MQADLHFAPEELALMFDTEIFPLKHRVHHKLYTLFETLKNTLKDTEIHRQFPFPEGTDTQTGKISRGENFAGYPWAMLDFPRLFNKDNTFAFRSMFWYGHYFSISLLLRGTSAEFFLPALLQHMEEPVEGGIFCSLDKDPWAHSLDSKMQVPLHRLGTNALTAHVRQMHYLRLSFRCKAKQPEKIVEEMRGYYAILLGMLY